MSRTIKQYRYYGDNNENNQPLRITKENMNSGDVFTSDSIIQDLGMITKLGIQGLPGTRVFINDSPTPILIGMMGVFELDVSDYSYIHSVRVDYESAALIENTENGYLIVDAIYDTEV